MEMIHTILADRRFEAEKFAVKARKKALRYGLGLSIVFGPVYVKEQRRGTLPDGSPRMLRTTLLDVTITGDEIRVPGHTFVAHIEHTEAGNYVDTVPGWEVDPRWRDAAQACEHCGTARRRKDTYIVRRDGDGTDIQIGRSCLRDYFGIDDPKKVMGKFRFNRWLKGATEEEFGGYGATGSQSVDLPEALALTNMLIHRYGWASKGAARNDDTMISTASLLANLLWPGQDRSAQLAAREMRETVKDSDHQMASTVLDWVRGWDDSSDYAHNLRLSCHDDILSDERRLGLAISAIQAYHRATERTLKVAERRARSALSVWQGVLKERIEVDVELVMNRFMGTSQWGDGHLLKFVDGAGNIYTWFTGVPVDADQGDRVSIVGTVKAHREYNGVEETQLTRVRVAV